MPTLLEVQQTIRNRIIGRDAGEAAALLAADYPPDRFDIYRNTVVLALTKALQLNFPAVRLLVGAEFFDGAAQLFIAEHPPRDAYLDRYGDDFPEFLRNFSPAKSLAYLADVAALEWAVSCAIHAPDVPPLDLRKLALLAPDDHCRVRFVAHPAVRLLVADHPVDRIWRAVLAGDDAALSILDVDEGPVFLLVERRETGVEVGRLDEPAWRFMAQLCVGCTIEFAQQAADGIDAPTELAKHLAHGRFVDFAVSGAESTAPAAGKLR
jgi:Putative DNA-binding domain